MKDRSTAILGMLGIYLVYKAPRGVVCKWLLTTRSNFASLCMAMKHERMLQN